VRRLALAGTLGVIAVGLVAAPGASARAKPEAVMELQGTNGYRVSIDASAGAPVLFAGKAARLGVPDGRIPKTGTGTVTVSVSKHRSSESDYFVPGIVTARRIRARLGKLGVLYVRFKAERTRRVALPRPCTGSVVVRTGTFTGTIRFHGEDDYTRVDAGDARGRVLLYHDASCPTNRGAGDAAAEQHGTAVIAKTPESYFVAFKDDTKARPICLALANDSLGPVEILRIILINPGPGAFTFDAGLTRAHLDLPTPFAGVGNFAAPRAWTGTLEASFPGAPNVPFAGAAYRAYMKRL
jgi:hypothetical protein